MTIIKLHINVMMLTDVQRRSFYITLTLFNRTVYFQYWPRGNSSVPWSCGYRKE